MAYAFDEKKDAKWITIHPHGSEHGKHVMINGEGEIVAGNPHLVAALKEKKQKKGSGTEVHGDEMPDDLGDFTPPSADDFGDDIFDNFTTPDDFSDSLEEDEPWIYVNLDVPTPDKAGRFSFGGQEYHVGTGSYMPGGLFNELAKKSIGEDNNVSLFDIQGSWSGDPEKVKKVAAWLGDKHPYVKALLERKEYVDYVRANETKVDIEVEAEKTSLNEAAKYLGVMVGTMVYQHSKIPLSTKQKNKDLTKGSKKGKIKTIQYVAAAIKSFRSRFPNAQLLVTLKKLQFYPSKPLGGNTAGVCYPGLKLIALDTTFNHDSSFADWRKRNPFVLGPNQGAVPGTVRCYYPAGMEAYSTLWHETAHQLYHHMGGDVMNMKWFDAIDEAYDKYGFRDKHVSNYACKNKNEYHSEVVALMASPNYIQGSMPEPIERYVYEEIFGCAKDTWKKNESQWKPKA